MSDRETNDPSPLPDPLAIKDARRLLPVMHTLEATALRIAPHDLYNTSIIVETVYVARNLRRRGVIDAAGIANDVCTLYNKKQRRNNRCRRRAGIK